MSSKCWLKTLDKSYSLGLTLYPSFILPLFERLDNAYVKLYGCCKGAVIRQVGQVVEAKGCSVIELLLWSGLWYDPRAALRRLTKRAKRLAEEVVKAYSGLRLAVSPMDRELVFISVFLSRRTDFHLNVVRWVKAVLSVSDDPEAIKLMDLRAIASSYQLAQLAEVYHDYLELSRAKGLLGIWDLRRRLLSLKFVGPKTVHAYMLFAYALPNMPPIDVHMVNFNERVGVLERGELRLPEKRYCKVYECPQCPIRDNCMFSLLVEEYGDLAGWLQTVAYVHDKMYCQRRLCGSCSLRHLCRA